MEMPAKKYRISIYEEITELSEGKVYIVKSSLDDKIYVKKVLPIANYEIYKKIKELNIPNIPTIYEIIDIDDKVIVIEEYISGYSLQEVLDKSETLSEEKVVEYTLDLIGILERLYCTDLIITHRDIKPSNILISNDGILKLIDFDISRTYKTDQSTDTAILGTYGYAAPEQFGFDQSDVRTDIYSIGVTMNVLLTGKLPIEELYMRNRNISEIISKCVEIDPKKRFQDINHLKKELLKQNAKYRLKTKEYRKSKLPGFRANIFFFKVMAFMWYSILFMCLVGLLDTEPVSEERVSNIAFALLLFSLTLLYGNYRDIKLKLPIINSKNLLVSFLGYILYTLLAFILFGIFTPH